MKDKIKEMVLFRLKQDKKLLMNNFSKEEGLNFIETGK